MLVYSLGAPVVSGDVALMEPDGTTVFELLRFYTPVAGGNSDVIVYAQPNGTLAGVGIPSSGQSCGGDPRSQPANVLDSRF